MLPAILMNSLIIPVIRLLIPTYFSEYSFEFSYSS